MQAQLGFQAGDYNELANAFNEAFDTSVTAADLQPLATVQDVYTYMENL
jgi:acyl carrier protein